MGLPGEQVSRLRKNYFEEYGTTLRGLQYHHKVDADEYLAYVHDIPLQDYLHDSPTLRVIISSLPQECWIYTNADNDHARRVLNFLGLSEYFVGIIDIRSTEFACKPQEESFQKALSISGNPNAHECVMIDDSLRNLIAAGSIGMTTVLIDDRTGGLDEVDYTIPNLHALPERIPDLW